MASDYGTTGLIDIPTARFDEDGVFAVGASIDERHRQFSLPIRQHRGYRARLGTQALMNFSCGTVTTSFKARLWKEELYLPQVAVGIRDIVGTGVFGSEYVVASKQIGDTDVTLGVGWGRLAGKGLVSNPLNQIYDRFAVRSSDAGLGGEFSFGDFFSVLKSEYSEA